jgi:sulfoxide reductase heme-binding subunit YedZ
MSGNVPAIWLLARASGLVAFGLLTLSVWLGLAMSTRVLGPKRQKSLFGWHQTLVGTALAMVALHGLTVMLDPVLHFGPASVLVPFVAAWKPAGVAAGVIGGWLTLMLALSFRAKRWLGHRTWRVMHYASFAAFVLFLGHALTVGTDLKGLTGPVVVALAAGPVIWLSLARILLPARSAPKPAVAQA